MQVGFVGLGVMGAPMARNLLKAGHSLTVFDRDDAKAGVFLASGAKLATSARECARECDAVITCLPGPSEVRTVMTGEEGLLAGFRNGATWIDATTNRPDVFKSLAAEAECASVQSLDAPVAGAVYGANHGTLTIFVGGDVAVLEKNRPIFEAMGRPIHMGPWGAGLTAKLVTNLLWFIQTVAIGEAMVLGVGAGLNPLVLWDAMKRSAGNSVAVEHDMPSIFAGHYDPSFSLALSLKDLRLVSELASSLGIPLDLAKSVESVYVKTQDLYGPDKAVFHVVKRLEDATGISLRAPGDWPAPWER